jgi:deoxyribonuclease V
MAQKLPLHHQHAWDLSPEEAQQVQQSLRGEVRVEPLGLDQVRRVAGIDAGFGEDRVYAAAVLLDFPGLRVVEQAVAAAPLLFPYIPGLLSFREAPAMLAALAQLNQLPDVLMVDGHGLAHPRRFGIACHLGVLLDLPAIGCAKSILVGRAGPLDEAVGSTAGLAAGGELLGQAIRTRQNVKPVYISVGHRVDLPSAVRIALACARGYRLPEPTRLAHNLVTQHRSAGT